MSAQDVYNVTNSPPQYRAERFAIVGGLEDSSTDEFDKYIANINEILGSLDDYQIDPEPALIVGSFHGESIGKSASTVEADLREMFGYHKVIKPVFMRKVKPRRKKKPAKGATKGKAKAKRKHVKKKGGDDDSDSDDLIEASVITDSANDDYDNAKAIDNMSINAPRNILEDLF